MVLNGHQIVWLSAMPISKDIGYKEPYCGIKISLYSFIWACLAVFFKLTFI